MRRERPKRKLISVISDKVSKGFEDLKAMIYKSSMPCADKAKMDRKVERLRNDVEDDYKDKE